MAHEKIWKSAVLYLHKPNTDYQCRDCSMFIAKTLTSSGGRCSIHGPNDVIQPHGSCGFFVKGKPMPNMRPMSEVTTLESGYAEHDEGFSCKRCANFSGDVYDCHVVDRQSPGDDQGLIHPDACCNAWESLDSEPEEEEYEDDTYEENE